MCFHSVFKKSSLDYWRAIKKTLDIAQQLVDIKDEQIKIIKCYQKSFLFH